MIAFGRLLYDHGLDVEKPSWCCEEIYTHVGIDLVEVASVYLASHVDYRNGLDELE